MQPKLKIKKAHFGVPFFVRVFSIEYFERFYWRPRHAGSAWTNWKIRFLFKPSTEVFAKPAVKKIGSQKNLMLQLCTQQGTDAQCWVALRKKTSAECGKMAALQGIFPSEGAPEGRGLQRDPMLGIGAARSQ